MSLRGVIRGRTIELEQEPPLPDGTQVEVELISPVPSENPFWGRWRKYADLLTEIEQEILTARESTAWRSLNGEGAD
ncbi:MAG: hypothetical protein WHS44_04645 [Fimbriimonadales bacterium]|nr:MAG: hypothetical protein KatS3mg018_2643 [Fimbriimonadales bacterium]